MGLDDPLGLRNHLSERGELNGSDDGAGVVVDDGEPGQAQLDDVDAVTPIEAGLHMARSHVDKVSRLSTELPTVQHVVRNAVQSIAQTAFSIDHLPASGTNRRVSYEGLPHRLPDPSPWHAGLWVGSRVDAAQACKQIVESGDCSPGGEPKARRVEVPIDRTNLIKWLNVQRQGLTSCNRLHGRSNRMWDAAAGAHARQHPEAQAD